ncbi:uncharacterized protein ACLA_032750 [Aspergillus clavatus NRRL 1]|uniref:Secreted protein n=1 Tax=Aspergillus clavatus (strain ATCC 1007 / CBS 513.65 / DSM 816 / NCTC 3887 / NRRL 1 / QM 1276 / 107) TaxID=344612 RepID=A1CSB8_ASPCL|nr:uncharacterized protein ACLA_032750 [Aspergillus clavatus NRRL 1]EAW08539.1 hypothetical protein ACLA_032750 [Aspergillus clavatus NRRL 1]
MSLFLLHLMLLMLMMLMTNMGCFFLAKSERQQSASTNKLLKFWAADGARDLHQAQVLRSGEKERLILTLR